MRVLRVSHSAVVGAWRERERALRRRGVDVTLLSAVVWDEGGRPVRLVPDDGEPVVGVPTRGSHPALFLYDPWPLWRALGEPHDVLDIHEEPFALATVEVLAVRAARRASDRLRGRQVGPPAPFLVYSAQNIHKRYPVPFRWIERAVLRRAAGVHVCNDGAAWVVRAKGARGEVAVISLGVDAAAFCPAPGDAAHVREIGTRRVGYAGRLAPHKGVDVLLRAVADDERLLLDVAGDGPSRAVLEYAARPLGDRVRFLGPLDGDALVAFYRSLDVLAVPSLDTTGWREQFGRVAVEAMACGVPVVASDSGALPDVVGGAGLLVPPGDADALCAALTRVLDEDGLADRLRAGGWGRAATCSWDEVARRYEELYRSVLGEEHAAIPGRGGTRLEALAEPEPPEVVVVAYGAPEMVRAALAPLTGKFPLTVSDNSSMPEIHEITDLAGGRYLDPGRNGGFAAGVNHALAHRQVPGTDVLLLNPDAVISPEDVRALQHALHARDDIASVGPVQVDGNGTSARVAWPYPSPVATWVEAVGLARLRRTPPDRSFVVGSVLLLSARALADVGGFDERFFLYAEETDWAYRAARRGWRHAVVPDAHAVHLGGATSSDPARRETHFHASLERYLRKHYGTAGWAAARGGAVVGAAARSVALRAPARDQARRRLRLYLAGPVRAEAAL